MKKRVSHNGRKISENVSVADNFFKSLMGFMFKARPNDDTGILFTTNSIQTHFMRFDLDVVFLSKTYEVVKIMRGLRPWRMTWFYFKARYVLELPSGVLPADVKEGDRLEVENV